MRFYDRVDIMAQDGKTVAHADVPAIVGTATSVEADALGAPYGSLTTLRALVPPEYEALVSVTNRVRWRGTVYSIPSAPVPRMRRDRVHHLTVPLELSAGV